MPIYAYRCESCGFAKDVLQKMSDAPLTQCPECQAAAFRKQVTAAGFQLKGSGWYVTDFRGGNSGAASGKKDADDAKPAASAGATADTVNSNGSNGSTGATGSTSAANSSTTASPAAPASTAAET